MGAIRLVYVALKCFFFSALVDLAREQISAGLGLPRKKQGHSPLTLRSDGPSVEVIATCALVPLVIDSFNGCDSERLSWSGTINSML
jgi:hypothetical protein